MKGTIGFFLVLLVSAPAWAADTYLCITEKGAGLSYNKTTKEYQTTTFTTGKKYLLKKSKRKDAYWEVSEFGKRQLSVGTYRCDKPKYKEQIELFCESSFSKFKFNKNNLRFIMTDNSGYTLVGETFGNSTIKDGENDIVIKIGRCSLI